MMRLFRLALASFFVMLAGALQVGVASANQHDPDAESSDRIVIGDDVLIVNNETVTGTVVVIGGLFRMEEGGYVTEDLIVLGGAIELDGRVGGDVVSIGGNVVIAETAQVGGDTIVIGATATIATGAALAGEYVKTPGPDLDRLSVLRELSIGDILPLRPEVDVASTLFASLRNAIALALLGLLLALMWPRSLQRIGQAVEHAPGTAGSIGFFSLFLFPLLTILMVATLILIPLALLFVLAVLFMLLLGWTAAGLLIGQRLLAPANIGQNSPWLAAALGTFAPTFLLGVVRIIPLPGIAILGVLITLALLAVISGATILTRFGLRPYGQTRTKDKAAQTSTTDLPPG